MAGKRMIIAVSGMSGAGKSSVLKHTARLLPNSVLLHFDDYDDVSIFPPDLEIWLRKGGDLCAWKTPQLANDLEKLKAGQTISLPGNRGIVKPAEYILVEEPFGKSRFETAQHIDFSAHIDVPIDVLLARRILRRLTEERAQLGDKIEDRLLNDIQGYLNIGRDLNIHGNQLPKDHADLILDGLKSIKILAEELVRALDHIR